MMKSLICFSLKSLLFLVFVVFSYGVNDVSASSTPTPIPNVQVSLRGKKYQIEDVTTVNELQERISDLSGVKASDQGRVLFNGQQLKGGDSLSAAGVSSGDQLNIVPKKKKSSSATASSASSKSSSSSSSSSSAVDSASEADPSLKVKEMLQQSGIDTDKLDDVFKGMGGGNGEEAPSMQESMEMMTDMMKSPIFSEYMNDPERLEESRQMILNNPMMKSMMAGMPGMEELLNDPDAWREAMQAAASMYQNMDSNDLMQAMMGGAAGAGAPGGMPPGLFDGMDTGKTETLALDELSEGED